MGSVWELLVLSAHTGPIYLTHFEGSYNYSHLVLTNFIGISYIYERFFFDQNASYIELYMGSFMSVVCVFSLRV